MVGRGARWALVAAVTFAMLASAAPSAPSRTGDPVLDVLLLSLDMEKKGPAKTPRSSRERPSASPSPRPTSRPPWRGSRDSSPTGAPSGPLESGRCRRRGARRSLVQQERRRSIGESLAEHGRRAAALREEIAKRREGLRVTSDPVTGRWDVTISPGNRRGTLRLALDGTIVSGDYVLDGGFRGSVRGTFVGDRLSLDRIDAERGFDAKFYGRVTTGAARRIGGTWEATMIAPATGPSGGTWSAQPAREDEGEPR